MIVVDATVLAYYVIEGDFTATTVRVREKDPGWVAPELWRSELMNVLWTYVRRGDFDTDLALERFDLAEDLIGPRTYAVTAAEVLPLAVASGCTAYDSQYVALARRLSLRLVSYQHGDVHKPFCTYLAVMQAGSLPNDRSTFTLRLDPKLLERLDALIEQDAKADDGRLDV